MPTGRVLVGAGTGYAAGGTGGNKTVTLTVDQMPSHSHANTLTAAGGHSHSRGSMEIVGHLSDRRAGISATPVFYSSGALSNVGTTTWPCQVREESQEFSDGVQFTASKGWSGATNTVANHNHTITNASTGSGSAVNIEQPWLAVYMWKRTK